MTLNIEHELDDADTAIDTIAPVIISRPVCPKSKRRARVLEPDQIAASRGETYAEPVAEPVVKPVVRPVTEPKIVMQDHSEESSSKLGDLTGVVS
ncbi:MAG: hypothetical protein QNK92_10630 [Amylibacter sp.]